MSTARIEALKQELFELRNSWRTMFAQLEQAEAVIEELRAELAELKQRRPIVEIRHVNDGFALYEAERLVRGGFDRRHTAMLWALDQGLSVHTDKPIEVTR